MTNQDFLNYILCADLSAEENPANEDSIKELSGLISGNLVYRLYEKLDIHGYSIPAITAHLEMLGNIGNYVGLLYFVYLLSDAVEEALPPQFMDLVSNYISATFLASALIEDWLDYDEDYLS